MAMQIQFDTLAGAQVEVAGQLSTIVRTGLITDVPGNATSDPSILIRATQAVFDQGIQGYPGKQSGKPNLSSLTLRSAANTNDLMFRATYIIATDSSFDAAGITTWLVELSNSTQMETEQIDLNGCPIQTVYYYNAGTNTKAQPGQNGGLTNVYTSEQIPSIHTADMSVLRPRRTLTITGYTSRPVGLMLDAQNKVNIHKKWSGLPKGYWLCTEVQSRSENAFPTMGNKQLFMYKTKATFVSKVVRDWSHYAIHRTMAGKVPPEMMSDTFATAIKQLVYTKPYDTKQDRTINGVLKVGLYHTANFNQAFNFDLDKY